MSLEASGCRRARAAPPDLVARAVAGLDRREGALLLLEGPAGIGKTALMRTVREEATRSDVRVLTAIASELDREFAFGLVQQLLGVELATATEERRARLLAGAAGFAASVFDPRAIQVEGADPSHALLHGLYWLVANLAEEGPLALLADDLHWADRPSLRALEFLSRRLDGLPVLVVGSLRPSEPGADKALLDALAAGASTRILRPAPLGPTAAATLLAELMPEAPGSAFTASAHVLTGGNPLLLSELARAAADRGLRGLDHEAPQLPELTADGVAPTLMRRIRALGEDPVAVARAAAISGPRTRVGDLAAIAGLSEAAVAAALDALVGAAVLMPDERSFTHPLVRAAVEADIAPTLRARMHAAAADRLAAQGARPAEVAVHLLASEPAGAPAVVEQLRAAAAAARAEGAVDVAVRHLGRALIEPPDRHDRPGVLLELGEAELLAGEPDAWEHLDEAAALATEGDARARARLAQAGMLVGGLRSAEAVPLLEEAREAATDPSLTEEAERLLFQAVHFDLRLRSRWERLLDDDELPPDAASTLVVNRAYLEALTLRPGAGVREMRRLAVSGSYERTPGDSMTHALAMCVFVWLEEAEVARTLIDAGEAEARRRGSHVDALTSEVLSGIWHRTFGSLSLAEAATRRSVELALEGGYSFMPAEVGEAIDVLLERDDLDGAEALAAHLPDLRAHEHYLVTSRVHAALGRLRHLQGRGAEAERHLREAVRLDAAWGFTAPLYTRARLSLATLLAARGEREEARALIEAETEVARRAGLAGAQGACLRAQALVDDGDAAVALLEEARAQLARTPLTLELGWALHDLGARLRRSGARTEARARLREALDLADRIGAVRLARLVREELLAAGGRPRREALTGPSALTPSERRVTELATRGLSNREIAETLWVTRKTVEVHLGNAYGKLGIRSRTQLPEALAHP